VHSSLRKRGFNARRVNGFAAKRVKEVGDDRFGISDEAADQFLRC
jgi:hypothetical protein